LNEEEEEEEERDIRSITLHSIRNSRLNNKKTVLEKKNERKKEK
jgi:hypothetical protein